MISPPLYWPPESPPVFHVRHVRNQIVKCVLPTNGLIRGEHYVVTLVVPPSGMWGEMVRVTPVNSNYGAAGEYWPWRFEAVAAKPPYSRREE